ncbi:MAG: GntR family transcriptional regulator [Terriglobales bacterium]
MTLKTMRKRSFRHGRLSSQVVLQVENMIAEKFRPGMLLPTEDELAEQFSVSRIVIREAMKILEDRGVVEVRAGRGTIGVPPSSDRVKVIFASVNGSAFYNAHSKKVLLHHSPVEVNDRNNLSRIRSCMENLGPGDQGDW